MKRVHLSLSLVFLLIASFLFSQKVSAWESYIYPDYLEMGVNEERRIEAFISEEGGNVTYSSSDEDIVRVYADGEVFGVSEGTATITVGRHDGARRKTIDTVVVVVKKATLDKSRLEGMEFVHQPGMYKDEYWGGTVMPVSEEDGSYLGIENQNPEATYKFISSNKNILKIKKDGTVVSTNGIGTVKITVKETYQKKTRKLGTYKVKVVAPKLYDEELELTYYKGSVISPREYMNAVGDYKAVLTDEEIDIKTFNPDTDLSSISSTRLEWNYDYFDYVNAIGKGRAYIYLYSYDYKNKSYDNYFGKITVNVLEVNEINRIIPDPIVLGTWTDYEFSSFDFSTDPYNYTGDFSVIALDSSIVEIVEVIPSVFFEEDSYRAEVIFRPLKAGQTTVIITAGDVSEEMTIFVYEPEAWD